MKVLKLCIGTWDNASHDKRELSVCREMGAEVEVLAKGDENHPEGFVDGFYVTRLSARPLKHMPVALNRIASIFTWAGYIRKRKDIDIISCHDWPALIIGYLSNWFKGKKAKLVYDSHEFTLGVGEMKPLKKWVLRISERHLIRKCSFSLMVSDCIADEVQRVHRLKKRPYVVRNIPERWELDSEKSEAIKKEFLRELHMPEDTFIIMYHGGIMQSRGIECLLKAAQRIENLAVVILGNGQSDYVEQIRKLCDSLGITERVLFHKAVCLGELRFYAGAADIGVSILLPVCQNHRWSLPNKFFENIQCLNPLIVSDFPEMGKIVDAYDIGLKVNPENPDEIAEAIRKMQTDKDLYRKFKENLVRAKEELCWENEKKKLIEAYETILKK